MAEGWLEGNDEGGLGGAKNLDNCAPQARFQEAQHHTFKHGTDDGLANGAGIGLHDDLEGRRSLCQLLVYFVATLR